MYKYKAFVTRVVDGDTFDAIVDLGYNINTKQRFRIKDIDTPETWRPSSEREKEHGELATKFTADAIENTNVILTSIKIASYGRYEANVELNDGSDLCVLLKENGFDKLESYDN